MQRTFFFLLIVSLFLINAAQAEVKVDNFIVKPGLLRKIAVQNYITYKETTKIPLVLSKDDPDFGFGYTIHHKNGRTFRHLVIFTMPEPKHYTGNLNNSRVKKTSGGRVKIVNKEITNKGYGYFLLRFDEGDPEGLYQASVYIDKKLLTTINYDVKRIKK